MPIPDFQATMLPLLQHLADGNEHDNAETHQALSRMFGLTEEEQQQLLPSGKAKIFTNRLAWAKSYLKRFGLIANPSRGAYAITAKGLSLLQASPPRVDLKLLQSLDADAGNQTDAYTGPLLEESPCGNGPMDDPFSQIEQCHATLEQALQGELLSLVRRASPAFFERLVIDLLLKMGYGGSYTDAARTLGATGDGGVDGVINEDRLGLDTVYIQAKRWQDSTVGRPEIQKFVGALMGRHSSKGIFLTTSSFTKDAREYVAAIPYRIILIDGQTLTRYMIQYDVGVAVHTTYAIKRIAMDYFDQE
ncbi:restriction endonuclease [Megalodesulfovibrio gigas]|uniref:Putative restriction endonuclease n=1 Tax=Megalodesulfovibrio gigas (strain ATCC 19364 / DSM 1382 / NCIMB 9332 / VKM B-1759) TaxID=1121448 RepID=T2GBI0_MEGG1|nr:restriction endonuclease [Megalodesulfovibrio gigas]AGW13945.1 putative restriction endonuclease [Megalodesulfovibrio gigas DSM 1382 = ATCC 19364]